MAIAVTGGTKGIGLAIALRFSQPGNDVFVNYHSDEAAAAVAASRIEERGARAHTVRADVGTPDGIRRLMAAVAEQVDRLDQLVHCAVRVVPGPALEADPDAFAAAVHLNGTTLHHLVQAALPLLHRGSTVFYISSRGGRAVLPGYASVGVAKALGESLVRYLATELAPRGVRINAVAPGAVDTEAFRAVFGAASEEVLAESVATNPSGRMVTDDDYTALVEFLSRPEAAMIQGQVIFVNGGQNLMA
ncbi:MAG TPA: SDR family oxidoreductase [Acidimicrobiia bacterium]|nr:SDR family oxidoreductase [Acidimicrobiia bacterium]